MGFIFSKPKGCKVLGKDIKNLINSSQGVLAYDGERLKFVSFDDMIVKYLSGCHEKKNKVIVFISNMFNLIKELEDDREYILEFSFVGLEFWDSNHEHLKLFIDGIQMRF